MGPVLAKYDPWKMPDRLLPKQPVFATGTPLPSVFNTSAYQFEVIASYNPRVMRALCNIL